MIWEKYLQKIVCGVFYLSCVNSVGRSLHVLNLEKAD